MSQTLSRHVLPYLSALEPRQTRHLSKEMSYVWQRGRVRILDWRKSKMVRKNNISSACPALSTAHFLGTFAPRGYLVGTYRESVCSTY